MIDVVKELPCFADLPEERKRLDSLRKMYQKPPVLYMTFEDLMEEKCKIRGSYELSQPTIDTELALKYGRSATQYLSRDPDWRQSHRPHESIYLCEMTPVRSDYGGRQSYANIRWHIIVIGEDAQKERRFQERAQLARAWRAA